MYIININKIRTGHRAGLRHLAALGVRNLVDPKAEFRQEQQLGQLPSGAHQPKRGEGNARSFS